MLHWTPNESSTRAAATVSSALEWGPRLALLLGCAAMLLGAAGAQAADAAAMAAEMARLSGRSGGMVGVVGAGTPDLPAGFARCGSFAVHCLVAGSGRSREMRDLLRSQGLSGTVAVQDWSGPRLPYAGNLLTLVVVEDHAAITGAALDLGEILRVTAPLGTVFFGESPTASGSPEWRSELASALRLRGIDQVESVEIFDRRWLRATKPWPDAIDEWSHYLHGADGNPVAEDITVGPPKHFQWLSGPLWMRCHETDSSISTQVTARGRLFSIIDEAPISLPGDNPLPDKWFLVAQDAFNGALLWKVPIRRWGWREWKPNWFTNRPGDFPLDIRKRLAAVGDAVYVTLGYRAPVSRLDAETGRVAMVYPQTEGAGEILVLDGRLIVPVISDDLRGRVVAVDTRTGQTLWTSPQTYRGTTVDYLKWTPYRGAGQPERIYPALNLAAQGDTVALIDGEALVALDLHTGAERWRAAFPVADADRAAGGVAAGDSLWNGTVIVRDGVVVHASPGRLAAFAADSGTLLWMQDKRYIGHLWYAWKDVFVIDGLVWTWSAELDQGTFTTGGREQRTLWPRSVNGYGLRTGELVREVPLGAIFRTYHHHRCYRNKATSRFILASRRGTEFVDLQGGVHTVHNWVRGTCHVGMIPANGLHYAPPHPCACYIDEKLNGMLALAPARSDAPPLEAPDAPGRHERGPAPAPVAAAESPAGDWAQFRGDALRTGAVPTDVPDHAQVLWRTVPGTHVSAPIAAGGRVFAALVDEHRLVCLDGRAGQVLWDVGTGARVDSPPAYGGGRLFFGSADGWVTCLDAADGGLVWRFRAAPAERLIGAFGQLESAWPVHGSVLLLGDSVYAAAGRTSHLDGGIFLYRLDAATGAVRAHTQLSGPDYAEGDFEENFRLPMGTLPDVLMSDGQRLFMRSAAFDLDLRRQPGNPALQVPAGFLDDSYFKRTPWRHSGDYGRVIVQDGKSVYYVRMFDSLKALDPNVFFTPGKEGYLLFGKDLQGSRKTWMGRLPVRVRAMVLAGSRLFVAGPPDRVDFDDPLGAFEGREGGKLCVFDASSGELLRQVDLPAPPVFNGMAAAAGRLILADVAGGILTLGVE